MAIWERLDGDIGPIEKAKVAEAEAKKGIRSPGDGGDPPPPEQYGPPSKQWYEIKAAREAAGRKERAGQERAGREYRAKLARNR